MANRTLSVANWFLQKAQDEGKHLTLMQVMKLVYFAHGWNLAIQDDALISENFEAWRFGPVVSSLYHLGKIHGSHPINGLLIDTWTGKSEMPTLDSVESTILDAVWTSYGHRGAFELSAMTHEKGSPWWKTYEEDGGKNKPHAVISNELIKHYFVSKLPPP